MVVFDSQLQSFAAEFHAHKFTDRPRAVANAKEGVRLARESGNAHDELAFLIWQIDIGLSTRELESSYLLFDRAFPLSTEVGDNEMSARLHYLHTAYGMSFDRGFDEHIEELMLSRSLGQGTENRDWRAQTSIAISDGYYEARSDYVKALEFAEEALSLEPSNWLKAQALSMLGAIHVAIGDIETATTLHVEALNVLEGSPQKRTVQSVQVGLGFCRMEQKEYHRAQDLFQQALDNTSTRNADALLYSAKAYCYTQEFESARTQLERCRQISSTGFVRVQCEVILAEVLIHEGRAVEALATLRAVEQSVEQDFQYLRNEFYEALSKTHVALGNWQAAHEYLLKMNEVNRKAEKDKLGLRLDIMNHRLALERDRIEKEKHRSRAERLEQELASRALQLSSYAEALDNLRNDFRGILREVHDPLGALKKVHERLKALPCKQVDWTSFENQFDSANPEFKPRLEKQFPLLSPMELRVCSLVKLDLKTQDIARLFCITTRAVEFHRLNLRKKFKLRKDDSLHKFLVSV